MTELNKKLGFSLTNIVSGGLLIMIGLFFIIFGGTLFLNKLGLGGVTVFIYSIQNKLFDLRFINYIGGAILIGFLYFLWRFLRKKDRKEEKPN